MSWDHLIYSHRHQLTIQNCVDEDEFQTKTSSLPQEFPEQRQYVHRRHRDRGEHEPLHQEDGVRRQGATRHQGHRYREGKMFL